MYQHTRRLGAFAAAGFLALVACGVTPASASTYTYDVSYDVNNVLVTGTIVTTCNNCNLQPADLISWSFTSSDGLNINSSQSGAFSTMFAWPSSPLFVVPSDIYYSPTASGDIYFYGTSANEGNTFDNTAGPAWGYFPDPRNVESGATSFIVATVETPLPAALPLFATGLGGLGLLGWRRKRKAQAA
jgi:hypothetical protein